MTFLKKGSWILLLLLVTIIACNESTEPKDGSSTTVTDSIGEGGTVTLKLNLTEGAEFKQSIITDMNITMNMGEKMGNMDQKMTMGMLFSNKVLSAGDSTKIEMIFDRAQMGMNMMGMSVNIDTDSLEQQQDNPMVKELGKVYGMLIGKPLVTTYLPNATVVSTEGMDMILAEMAEKNNVDPKQLESLSQNMNQNVNSYIVAFPDKPLSIGDTWTKEATQNNQGMGVISTNTYTLTDVKDGIAYVELSGVLTVDTKGLEELGMSAEDMTMSGTQTGTLEVDVATGWTNNGTINQKMSTQMQMMGMSMTSDMDGVITIELQK